VVLIDHGREIAAGTPAQLKARVGEQRVDTVVTDAAQIELLDQALSASFATSVARDQRTVSIPAPNDVEDLARVTQAIHESGIAVDEVALRRPTLDDAFLALTGRPVNAELDGEADNDHGPTVTQEVAR
jgi:ABC-type multidrug transport system ATPase subunit